MPAQVAEASDKEPKIRVWDQWCVLSRRYYNRAGSLSLLDEANCRQVLENFARARDNLSCNINHDKNKVVAWYNAMALVVGGRCVALATHDPAVSAPSLAELPGGDDGSPPDDGIYWHRSELTSLGLAAAEFFRKVSPEFVSDAKNEHGDAIGYSGVGGAWTNYPFLDGCEKQEFTKEGHMGKKTYAQRCYEEAGIGDKDDDTSKYSKLSSFFRGRHTATYAKFERSGIVDEKDDDAKKYSKLVSYMAGKHDEPDGDEGGKGKGGQQMEDPQVQTGAPTHVTNPSKSTDQVAGQGHAMSKDTAGFQEFAQAMGLPRDPQAAAEKLRMLSDSAAELPQLRQQLHALTQARETDQKTQLAQARVQQDWRAGRIKPRHNETHAAAQARCVQLYTRDEQSYSDMLLDPGSFAPPEAMLHTFTQNGVTIGAAPPAGSVQEFARPDDMMLAEIGKLQKADPTLSTLDGARQVAQQNPQLGQRYRQQSALASLQPLLTGSFASGARA